MNLHIFLFNFAVDKVRGKMSVWKPNSPFENLRGWSLKNIACNDVCSSKLGGIHIHSDFAECSFLWPSGIFFISWYCIQETFHCSLLIWQLSLFWPQNSRHTPCIYSVISPLDQCKMSPSKVWNIGFEKDTGGRIVWWIHNLKMWWKCLKQNKNWGYHR